MLTVVTSTIRNRRWIMDPWLAALEALDITGDCIYLFLDDCSDDGTWEALQAWAATRADVLLLRNFEPFDATATSSRDCRNRKALYAHLADNRNRLIEQAIDLGADYLLSIDSDILPTPDLVPRLLAHARPYVATLINNVRTIRPTDLPRVSWSDACNIMEGGPDAYHHLRPVPLNTLVRCTLSGACMLLSHDALQARFANHDLGEDAGHAADLSRLGIPIYCDTTVSAVHCYRPSDLAIARETFTTLTSTPR